MNIFKVMLYALKFSFKSTSGTYVGGNVNLTQVALNNFFKAHEVILQKEHCLNFIAGNSKNLCKVPVTHVTPIFLADTCILDSLHEFFDLDVDYLHSHNMSVIKNNVLIIIANYLFYNHLKLYKILKHFLTLKKEVI